MPLVYIYKYMYWFLDSLYSRFNESVSYATDSDIFYGISSAQEKILRTNSARKHVFLVDFIFSAA